MMCLGLFAAPLAMGCSSEATDQPAADTDAAMRCGSDDNACTSDVREGGRCVHRPVADGTACSGGTCTAGACVPAPVDAGSDAAHDSGHDSSPSNDGSGDAVATGDSSADATGTGDASGDATASDAGDAGAGGDSSTTTNAIPDDRRITWDPGIPGGIPNRTTVCANVKNAPYGAVGNGVVDDTAAIQSALSACAAEQVVYIPTGTYRISGILNVPRSITVRGDGPGKTILDAHGAVWNGVITFGPGVSGDNGAVANITAGATKGSNVLTLDSLNGVAVGSYLQLDQLNDPAFVTIVSDEGSSTCTWCSRANGTRALGQISEITAVDPTTKTVHIDPPLYWGYTPTLQPQALAFAMGLKRAGVESLTVRANNTGYRSNFMMQGCAYCWLKNVEGDYTDGDQVDVFSSFRPEIRDSYFHDSFTKTPGQTDNDVFIAGKTTAALVENNVVWRLHTGIMLNWGAAGNVIAYNYLSSFWDANALNTAFPSVSMHGAHPMFNLFEGNVGTRFAPDGIWGSSSHNTVFRNWFSGKDSFCAPLSGRGPVDTTNCHTTFQVDRAIHLEFASTNYNVVGNILGTQSFATSQCYPYYGVSGCETVPPATYMIVAGTNQEEYDWPYIFSLGYAGFSSNPLESPKPAQTLRNHGNWDFVTHTVHLDPSVSAASLPPSLYKSGKPGWFGDRTWPPIEPTSNPQAIDATAIPAGYRFVHGTPPPGAN
jgi:hypothetical protein